MKWIIATKEIFENEDWGFGHFRYRQDKVKLETHVWEVKDGYLQKIGGTGTLLFPEIEMLDEGEKVKIICPECSSIQNAVIEDAWPFPIYVHKCTSCEYVIMESEWDEISDKDVKL